MEFDFLRDLDGRCRARCDMGHEAFGQWLTDEVDAAEADALLAAIAGLDEREREEFRKEYAEFTLALGDGEAELIGHGLAFDSGDLEEGMSYYDDAHYAGCGLDDLARLLTQWREFLTGR
ncbi:YacL family protein [Oceanimonas pelagia]|uniref:YacL family protein n=1 Tax=Oceanimonas pelagia TaxID=3028314 RepID=A0AA50QCB1_9GAMM|nr:YacL family protein [Oceanimonas pelagia]WMC11092.1 YacL family protein [Oceanimonas pelagia]